MKTEKQLQIRYTMFESFADLPIGAQILITETVVTRHNTYALYLKFRIGAAVLVGNGKIFTSSNQKSVAFPSGLCAERVSTHQAPTQCPDEIIKMTTISSTAEDLIEQPVPPRGACRQSLSEHETEQQQPIPVYFMGVRGPIIHTEFIKDLLPLLFNGSLLQRRKISANSSVIPRLSFAHPSVIVRTSGAGRTSETSGVGGISETSETSGISEANGTNEASETSGAGGIKIIKRVSYY